MLLIMLLCVVSGLRAVISQPVLCHSCLSAVYVYTAQPAVWCIHAHVVMPLLPLLLLLQVASW
jgi:hypothetical protein